ncbi:MAG: hypothetical protein R2794_07200 [Chitinophagales bacterium]
MKKIFLTTAILLAVCSGSLFAQSTEAQPKQPAVKSVQTENGQKIKVKKADRANVTEGKTDAKDASKLQVRQTNKSVKLKTEKRNEATQGTQAKEEKPKLEVKSTGNRKMVKAAEMKRGKQHKAVPAGDE